MTDATEHRDVIVLALPEFATAWRVPVTRSAFFCFLMLLPVSAFACPDFNYYPLTRET